MILVQVSLLGARDVFVRTRWEEFCYLKDHIKFKDTYYRTEFEELICLLNVFEFRLTFQKVPI